MRPEAGGRGGPRRHTHGGPVLTTGQLSKAAVEDNSTEACAPGQAWSVPGPEAVSKLRFCGCLPLENQYLRDKRWREKKGCFMQGASNLGRRWTADGSPKAMFSRPGGAGGFSRGGYENRDREGACVQERRVPGS